MSEEKVIIYGVKNDNKFHYIGKTKKKLNKNNLINKSNVTRQYTSKTIKEIFDNSKNIDIIPLEIIEESQWYDKKLDEIVVKYNEGNPLKNAQWMLDGKRGRFEGTKGYWFGKHRDDNTIKRLSESKFKKVYQYDTTGKLIKIWNSGKEVAIDVFKDYKVVKGSGETRLYDVLNSKTLKGRFKFESYWFFEKELIKYFNGIPLKINIDNIKKNEKVKAKKIYKKAHKARIINGQRRYTVNHFNKNGKIIKTYDNIDEAAYVLKKSRKMIQSICAGKRKSIHKDYILKYGEKKLQPINIKYPEYKIVNIKREKKEVQKTRTAVTVLEYNNNENINKHQNTEHAAIYYKLSKSMIRSICNNTKKNIDNLPKLKWGEKETVIIKYNI